MRWQGMYLKKWYRLYIKKDEERRNPREVAIYKTKWLGAKNTEDERRYSLYFERLKDAKAYIQKNYKDIF